MMVLTSAGVLAVVALVVGLINGVPQDLTKQKVSLAPASLNTTSPGCGGCGAGAVPGTKVRTCERMLQDADCIVMKRCIHRRPNFMGGGTMSVACPQVTKCNKTESFCCSNAFPVYAEAPTSGLETDLERIERHLEGPVACEIPNWTTWSSWSSCSKTCGGFGCGQRTRFRTCLNKDRVECSNSHHQVETEACGSSAPCETIQQKPCPRYSAFWWGWWGRTQRQANCATRVNECCKGYSNYGRMCLEIA
ncbi:thrombospondin type-1 domain-containing protein 7B-like [Lingula anatina]|uniref:Thrombospondin type-1 domain-containing protein 7B-like n=1 Tax=Lingula anatina TaxID=7574 RepID=A0A1S3IFR9_LINAN|nr:thrombospondin type-1 domain-containing protein 7B-like [Lingula anatina]|eukprot:XP_013397095.1 thrombospondin type-1 domain-containing protein 7B-like [Lingula anatina]